jgi:hypothetical protein
LNPTRLWRNSAGPREVATVATKQIINRGASRTMPDTANIISISLFEFSPIGRADEISANRKLLGVSTKPVMEGTPKNKFLKQPLNSTAFLLTLFYQINGRRTICASFYCEQDPY